MIEAPLMPRKKKAEIPVQHDRSGRAAGRTIKIAKDIVAMSRTVSSMLGQTQDQFITPLLVQAADHAQEEIQQDGVLSVRDRAEALEHLKDKGKLGTINTTEEIGTRLASLAGSALTSVGKLVDAHLRDLVEQKYQECLQKEAGRFNLSHSKIHAALTLPVLGDVLAGVPTEAFESLEEFSFKDWFGAEGVMLLRVKGKSMIEDHIVPGDLVALNTFKEAKSGDVVVALVRGKPTLKLYKLERDRRTGDMVAWLYPRNKDMERIPYEPASGDKILGVLIGVVRKGH